MSEEIAEDILGKASAMEKEYEWLQASDFYKRALSVIDEEDYFKKGEVQEKIGHSLHRAAFQAESREEFLERMQRAVEAYQKAHGFYEKLGDENKVAWMLRCNANSRYLEHWVASDSSEKRRFIRESLELEGKALKSFWDQGEKVYTVGHLPGSRTHFFKRLIANGTERPGGTQLRKAFRGEKRQLKHYLKPTTLTTNAKGGEGGSNIGA